MREYSKTPRGIVAALVILVGGIAMSVRSQDLGSLSQLPQRVYRSVDDVDLKLWLFEPDEEASEPRPSAVFFFGGGWNSGTPMQFVPHAKYLASRGMVGIVADYRVKSRHGATPYDCVDDARAAIRYLRGNAEALGLDPDRIAAGGGSAGGHIAAAAALVPEGPERASDVSCVPDALLLFNPVYDNGPDGYGYAQFGADYWDISPIHNIRRGAPPSFVVVGSDDPLLPVETAKRFQREMGEVGSYSELHVTPGATHGYFNHVEFRPGANPYHYYFTVEKMDQFLAKIGFLQGEPDIAPPVFRFRQNQEESTLDVIYGGKPVARYMYGFDDSTPERRFQTYKPFLHVYDADGDEFITKGAGGRLPHHRGIFLGYNRLKSDSGQRDLWHMNKGVQVHEAFEAKRANEEEAAFTSIVHWQSDEGTLLVKERRTFVFRRPTLRLHADIQMNSQLTAVDGAVVFDGDPEHAGAQFRAADDIVNQETVHFFEADDLDPRKDLDLRWVGQTFRVGPGKFTVTQLNLPGNPSGTRFSAYRDYGRFGAFPKASLDEGETLELNYRWLINPGDWKPIELIEELGLTSKRR